MVKSCYPVATRKEIFITFVPPKENNRKLTGSAMALKKNYRSDNTYMISTDTADNPKLGAKVLSDGRESLFLDFNFGFSWETSKNGKEYKKIDRRREYLSLYLWQAPRTPMERQQNKETLELAKKIRFEKGQQLLEGAEGYRLKKKADDLNFLDWMWAYYDAYTKGDKRHIKRSCTWFVTFLTETPEYSKYAKRIKPEQIDKPMILAFTEYIQAKFTGEGAHTLFARFKKIIKAAVEADVIRKNPCNGVIIKIDSQQLKKDVLSMEEIKQMITTHYNGENPNIRRAFIFCLYCGLRFCDVKDLTFANVDFSNRLLKFEQNKTKGHSNASGVIIPLNEALLGLIGSPSAAPVVDPEELTAQQAKGAQKPAKGAKAPALQDQLIFPLPSHTMCLKALRHWTERAGIAKHITWHCARHSFAVNLLNNGANIKTVASLLGHSGLKHTEKYTRAIDSLKQDAINSLPTFDL